MNDSEFTEYYRKRGIILKREQGQATAIQVVEDDHLNTMGSLHGGFITSLMDTCGCYALKTSDDIHPVTLNIQISFVNPVKATGQSIETRAKVIKLGSSLGHCQIETYSEGKIIAIGNLQAFIIRDN